MTTQTVQESTDSSAEPTTVRADRIRPGEIIVRASIEDERFGGVVRHVELSDDGGRVLLVFAGGETAWKGATEPVELMPREEYDATRERERAQRNRSRVLAGLKKLVELVEAGLPLPWQLGVTGSLRSVDEVRAAAELLGEEVRESDNAGRLSTAVEYDFGAGRHHEVVHLRFWHLGAPGSATHLGSAVAR